MLLDKLLNILILTNPTKEKIESFDFDASTREYNGR
jgi:hypothetical protein